MNTWMNYRQRPIEHTVQGDVRVLEGLWSPQLGNTRDILVYLPPSYELSPTRRYPVLYMHDGQNLFDQQTSFAGEWGVDKTQEALGQEGIEAIVVGIPNMGDQRLIEYSPFTDPRLGRGKGEQYLRFLIETLKPLVDRDLRTLPERETTGIMGSSMGGLISLYGFFTFPQVFGFVGALSPSLWFGRMAMFDVIRRAPAVPGKIYLDIGSEEGNYMVHTTRKMNTLLMEKGYRPGEDLLYLEDEGAGHNEQYWGTRLWMPLLFLLHDLCMNNGSVLVSEGA